MSGTFPTAGQFCWNELATPDTKSAREFYGKAFGWTFTEHQTEHGTYCMISCNGKEMAGMWQIPPNKQAHVPPNWMSYILVDHLASALENVKKHGAEVIVPIEKVGEMGQFAVIKDPTGAHVALWESTIK